MAANRRNPIKLAETWLKKGLNLLRGADYEPFLTVRDVPSKGWRTQMVSWTSQRLHHLLSHNEYRLFLLLDTNPEITDIREQYPLLPIEETKAIAKSLNVPYTKNGKDFVYTTDFLVTIGGNDIAINFKNSKDLLDSRVLEKLQIERCYWISRGVEFYVATEIDIDFAQAESIEQFHSYRHEKFSDLSSDVLNRALHKIYVSILWSPSVSISDLCKGIDSELDLPGGRSLALVKRQLAIGDWSLESGEYFNPQKPLKLEEDVG